MNIYGASGHAKVVIEIIESQKGKIDHVFDDNEALLHMLSYRVEHHPSEEKLQRAATIIAIGNNKIRKKLSTILKTEFAAFQAHISAVISPSAKIGKGTVIMAHASINSEAKIGKHCIVNTGAVVEHEVQLGDFVHISPNASIAGNVKIGEGTQIGVGASVIPNISIGKWAIIGAGAVIIENIPDFAVVVGNPGKIIHYNGNRN